MKKTVLFFLLSQLIIVGLYAQITPGTKCVNCANSEINITSSALGLQNTATGEASFASGKLNISEGDYSTTLGYGNTASGKYSLAGGEESVASGLRAFAYGQFAEAHGSRSLALGKYVTALGGSSVAIGRYVKTSTSDAMVIGYGVDSEHYLNNNINSSLMIGFNSDIPTLFVGPSSASGIGKVGIGTTDPTAQLEVNGTFKVTDWSYFQTINLGGYDIDQVDEIKGNNGIRFKGVPGTPSQMVLDENGRLGIGTTNPLSELQIGENWTFINPDLFPDKFICYNTYFDQTFKYMNTGEVSAIQFTAGGDIKMITAPTGAAENPIQTIKEGLTVYNSGHVGILTTTEPSEEFEVNGTMKSSGFQLQDENVSIGITDQTAKVEVTQTISGKYAMRLFHNKDTESNVLLIESNGGNADDNLLKINADLNGTPKDILLIKGDGNVGIGTATPNYKLDVDGNINFTGDLLHNELPFETSKWEENGSDIYYDDGNVGIGTSYPNAKLKIYTDNGTGLKVSTHHTGQWGYSIISDVVNDDTKAYVVKNDGDDMFQVYGNGRTYIGNSNSSYSGYMLTVNGKILSEDVKVVENVGADFVFYDDYNLPKLEDVEKFIEENNRLPEIPSAEEMKTNGVEIGDLQIKLLQKVEELTLYMIDQQKTIKKQQEEIDTQNREIEKLKKAVGSRQ
jgi:hypothetical protein